MSDRFFTHHPSAEQLQALLDGELPLRHARAVEGHVDGCVRCAGEVEALRAVFRELDELPRLVPLEGFSDRVLQGLAVPAPLPLAARVREALGALLPGGGHPTPHRLQELADGLLAETVAARVSDHVDRCADCAREAATWRTLLERLDGVGHLSPPPRFAEAVMERRALEAALDDLGHLAPSAGFAERVMAGVEWAPVPLVAPEGARGRLLAAARRLLPDTRRAWAAVSGVAVTPVVTVSLVLWAVFSHPTLTPGALLSFVGWKVSDLAALAWSAASTAVLESAGAFQLFTALQAVAGSPAAVAVGFLAFSVCTVLALWILYKNLLITSHPTDGGRYAHASF